MSTFGLTAGNPSRRVPLKKSRSERQYKDARPESFHDARHAYRMITFDRSGIAKISSSTCVSPCIDCICWLAVNLHHSSSIDARLNQRVLVNGS